MLRPGLDRKISRLLDLERTLAHRGLMRAAAVIRDRRWDLMLDRAALRSPVDRAGPIRGRGGAPL